jgi:hypothetical protein
VAFTNMRPFHSILTIAEFLCMFWTVWSGRKGKNGNGVSVGNGYSGLLHDELRCSRRTLKWSLFDEILLFALLPAEQDVENLRIYRPADIGSMRMI